jgi:alpha-tubulin suppressor-like RCC1 family protein
VYCWGDGDEGQLGPSFASSNRAIPAVITSGAVAIGIAGWHACVIQTSPNRVSCWGDSRPQPEILPLVTLGAGDPSQVSLGMSQTCVLDAHNDVYCEGDSTIGQLGVLSDGGVPLGKVAAFADAKNTSVHLGGQDTCVVKSDSTAWCVGANTKGELGRGQTGEPDPTPKPVIGLPIASGGNGDVLRPVASISLAGVYADTHACALLEDPCAKSGTVACWGGFTAQPPTRISAAQ